MLSRGRGVINAQALVLISSRADVWLLFAVMSLYGIEAWTLVVLGEGLERIAWA